MFANTPNLFPNQTVSDNQFDLFNLNPISEQSSNLDTINYNNNTNASSLFPVDFLNEASNSNLSTDLADIKPTTSSTLITANASSVDSFNFTGKNENGLQDLLTDSNDLSSLNAGMMAAAPTLTNTSTSGNNKCLDKNSILALYSQGAKSN